MKKHTDSSITDEALSIVAKALDASPAELRIENVSGGYSRNRRALVGNNDKWVFVKQVDVDTLPGEGTEELWWLKKDYLCAKTVCPILPDIVPTWSELIADNHVLIMTGYRREDGWLWSIPEDGDIQIKYIQAVIDATKKLETLQFDQETITQLKLKPYFRDELAFDDGFALVIHNEAIRNQLQNKYSSMLKSEDPLFLKEKYRHLLGLLNDELSLNKLAKEAAQLANQPNDCFGHCDVRSDNLTYNPTTGEVKFVDWNWASFTPKNFGSTEFLIDMARRGVEVGIWKKYLNPEALAAVVGFYLRRCLKDPLAPGNTLREMQAQSAAVAFHLYSILSN